MRYRRLLFVVFLAVPLVAQAPPPDTGIVDGAIQLRPLTTNKAVVVFSEAPDLTPAADDATVSVDDLTGDGVTVTFENFRVISRTPQVLNGIGSIKRIEWSAVANVAGLPADASINRTAMLTAKTADGKLLGRRRVNYVLSNKAAAVVTWTLIGPGDTLTVPPNDHAAFFVTVTGGPAKVTGLRSTLKDAATAKKFPEAALRICTQPPPRTCGDPTLAPGTPTQLYLVVDQKQLTDVCAGTYTGSIDVALDHASDTKSFNLTVHRSVWWVRLLGIGVILIGVLVSLLTTIVLRNAAARTEAMIPIEMLRETIRKLVEMLEKCGRNRSNSRDTYTALEDVENELATQKLRFIPKLISNPFEQPSPSIGYADFLQKQTDRLTLLRQLVKEGFCVTAKLREAHPTAEQKHFDSAFEKIDRLATNAAITSQELGVQLDNIETQLRTAIGVGVAKRDLATRVSPSLTPAEQLAIRVQVLNAGVWLLFAVVTTILGYLVMIAPTFGFGTAADLAKVFLWGLGVQTAGQTVQSLTPGTVTTAFGVQLPR